MTLASEEHPLSSKGEKDYEIYVDSKTFKLSGNERSEKIVELVEYYLSDDNVLKDQFLLKHVRRNREGYVSVKLITSYRKVKRLAKDWRIVAESLRQSTKLELNSDGDRVRRITPLPVDEGCSRAKSVIAYRLPFEKPVVEQVCSLFSSCGDISLIRILRPGCCVPADVRKLLSKNPEIATQISVLIEFEDCISVKAAMDVKEVKVLPLAETSEVSKTRGKKVTKPTENSSHLDSENYSRRSSSASSDYLSSSSSSSPSNCESRSQDPRTFSRVEPSVVENRNYRDNARHKSQLLSVIRLPKGPDSTKGFKDLRRSPLSVM